MGRNASDVGRSWGRDGKSTAGRNFWGQRGQFFPNMPSLELSLPMSSGLSAPYV